MPSEKFHEEQPLPDDDPKPDHPNPKEVVEEETVRNSAALAHLEEINVEEIDVKGVTCLLAAQMEALIER